MTGSTNTNPNVDSICIWSILPFLSYNSHISCIYDIWVSIEHMELLLISDQNMNIVTEWVH